MAHWSPAARAALATHLESADWPRFQAMFPDITYDAWESKRRRFKRDEAVTADVIEVDDAGGSYVGPSVCYWDLETTYSSQPRLLSGAGVDAWGNLTVFDQRVYAGRDDWLNDRAMAVAIRDYLEGFKIICGWNSKLFDVPVLNGRLIYWGERPIRPEMHVDLMYYAGGGFMRIGSKSLDNVSKFFSSPNRKTPLSVDIWERADHGSDEDYDLILEHNIADVKVTRDVSARLWPHVRTVHRGG